MALRKTSSENSNSLDVLGNSFRTTVRLFFRSHSRMGLPWRKTTDPYKITVSEVMLQQTQVSRVVEKYKQFLKAFPTVSSLAKAPLVDVLRAWSGLGYNRRAKFLHQMAQTIVCDHKGKFPKTVEGLQKLPGIGHYTAGAIYAFAFNKATPIIETNIRTVYIHHFFPKKKNISDKELMKLIEATLDRKNPRGWYWALMDYGSHLKANGFKNNTKSKHYTKQTKFAGSKRSVRGYIIKALLKKNLTLSQIKKGAPKSEHDIKTIINDLLKEKIIVYNNRQYALM